jgi:hypothetical protein
LERWVRRFRRPIIPTQNIGRIPTQDPVIPGPIQQPPEGPISAFTAGLRLAEQILFVFVASLWPNAVGGDPLPELREVNAIQPEQRQNEEEPDDDEDAQERANILVQ